MNLGPGLGFPTLEEEVALSFDPCVHAELIAPIRKHIRHLRYYLERLGTRDVEEYASRRGRRLDLGRLHTVLFARSPDLLVNMRREHACDAYVGVLIDRSGSMDGDKIQRAKAFGALVAESAKGLPGISGHISAFDGSCFIHLGGFQLNAVASLQTDDGNNDAGALARAADLALASGRRHKLLIMISDGSPTECTFESLKKLVEHLTRRHRIVCVQAAVQPISQIAFPDYVDLSRFSFEEAVMRFGRMLVRLTQSWH